MNKKSKYCIYSGNLKITFSFLLLFSLICAITYASEEQKAANRNSIQQQLVKGTVVDENGNPLPGVVIRLKGSDTKATTTDIDGNFSIDVPVGSTLVTSFVGFSSQEVPVTGSNLKIILKEESVKIDEVVIVAYGQQSKKTVTGSLSTVTSRDLAGQPVSNITQALAGRLPGLIVNQAGGRPGKDIANIKIRGIGTLDDGEASDPLIMIDGIERDKTSLAFLDPNEIESLSILKDASATAVFGVRGANGVVLVETKRGQKGKAQISYSGNFSMMNSTFKMNPIDAYSQTGLANEYMGFDANTTNTSAPYPQSERDRYKGVVEGNPVNPGDPYLYPNTNFEKLMLNDQAFQQQHNFTITGGTDVVRYYTSIGYFDQGGVFKNLNSASDKTTSYKRYNYRANIDVNITKTTLAKINIGGSSNNNTSLGQAGVDLDRTFYNNLFNFSPPWDGYLYDNKVVTKTNNANSVLLNTDMRGYTVELQNTADYSFILDQKLDMITKGLSMKGTASFVTYFRNFTDRTKDEKKIPTWKAVDNGDGTVSFYQDKEDILPFNNNSQDKTRKEYYELALNYNRTVASNHTFTALALVNADKSYYTLREWKEIPHSYLGFVGRVTYNFKNKYLAEFNAGYNGSENFAEGKRYGYFPAYSAGWIFTQESWIKNLIGDQILSFGKLRFSYGVVGNDKSLSSVNSRFLYLPGKYNMNNYGYNGWHEVGVNFGQPGSVINYPVAYQGSNANPNVTWETATKINYGADLNFFNNKLTFKADYFTEDREDILIDQQLAPVYQQAGNLALNLGKVNNSGYEIELGWNDQGVNSLRYWVNVNYTFARNKIIERDEAKKPLDYKNQTGKRIGQLWGYQQGGIFMTAEEAEAYKNELWETYLSKNPGADRNSYQAYKIFDAGKDVSAGDLKFIDRNGDGIISDLDEGYLDLVKFPESMFALNLGFQYKGLSFSALLQGASNFGINSRTNISPLPTQGSVMDFVLNRYTPERYAAGEEIDYPRLLKSNDNWKYNGTFWIQDASYLRLKTVEIGYTFGKTTKFIQAVGLGSLKLYVSGLNLYTLSKIKNLDPETTDGVLRYPRQQVFNLGINAQF